VSDFILLSTIASYVTHTFVDVATTTFVTLAVSAGNHALFVCTSMYVSGRYLTSTLYTNVHILGFYEHVRT